MAEASDRERFPTGSPPVALDGLKILLVEDENDARELLQTFLIGRGCEIVAAESVRDALLVVEEFCPDVILSDIGMPGADGYELIRAIRAMPQGDVSSTPAIALTAFVSSQDRKRASHAGFNIHLAKPVDLDALTAALAALAGRSAPR